ncbi:MAG: MBL fold metallo-hydrolase [Sphaerochaeta sp.]
MKIKCVKVGAIKTNCYIVESDTENGQSFTAVIDPGDDEELLLQTLSDINVNCIILTHAHFDHVGALAALHGRYPEAPIASGEFEDTDPEHIVSAAKRVLGRFYSYSGLSKNNGNVPEPDILLKDGDKIGPFTVIHTPGHTAGSICLYSKKDGILFSGDTLFRHSYGRTDFGGSESDMNISLLKLFTLEPDTAVYPGHEEPTTIGEEKEYFGL